MFSLKSKTGMDRGKTHLWINLRWYQKVATYRWLDSFQLPVASPSRRYGGNSFYDVTPSQQTSAALSLLISHRTHSLGRGVWNVISGGITSSSTSAVAQLWLGGIIYLSHSPNYWVWYAWADNLFGNKWKCGSQLPYSFHIYGLNETGLLSVRVDLSSLPTCFMVCRTSRQRNVSLKNFYFRN